MRMRSLAAASAVALALVVTGCGGDDASGSDTTTAPAGAIDTTTSGSDTTTGGESSDTTASFSGSANSEFCTKARELDESQQDLDLLGVSNPDPQELKTQLEQAGRALDDLGDVVQASG